MPPQASHPEDKIAATFGPNEWLVDELYEQYLADKNSVDEAWWEFFEDYSPADNPAGTTQSTPPGTNGSRAHDLPFAPESELSGIGDTDFLPAVWYRREVAIPEDWAGRRTLLHFGAVDHDATVWVDGEEVVRHRGGFTPFTADLGHRRGTVTVVVRARDDHRGPQARGKQSTRYDNYECLYTRTTGIWQTVWAEPVPDVSLGRPRITPDVAGSTFHLEQPLRRSGTGAVGDRAGWTLTASVRDAAGEVVTATVRADLDLDRFAVVDVSREPLDGDPGHSSDSVLRGTLSVGA